MNYNWEKEYEKRAESGNTLAIYKTTVDGIDVLAKIFISPTMNDLNHKCMVHADIYFQTIDIKKITDGFFHWISFDVLDLSRQYKNESELPPYCCFEYLIVNELPGFSIYSFGDFAYSDK